MLFCWFTVRLPNGTPRVVCSNVLSMQPLAQKILVVGGNGFIGKSCIPASLSHKQVQNHPNFRKALGRYARGEPVFDDATETTKVGSISESSGQVQGYLAGGEAHAHSSSRPPPQGTTDLRTRDVGIKEMLRGPGPKEENHT